MFLSPPLGGLGTMYDVHLGLIGKRVVDFLLVLIELFSLGVTAEGLRAEIDRKSAISLQRGQFDPKFQVEGVAPIESDVNRMVAGARGKRVTASHAAVAAAAGDTKSATKCSSKSNNARFTRACVKERVTLVVDSLEMCYQCYELIDGT